MNKARLFSSSPSCTQSTSIHNRLTPLEHWLLHAQLARYCCLSSGSGWELTISSHRGWQFEAPNVHGSCGARSLPWPPSIGPLASWPPGRICPKTLSCAAISGATTVVAVGVAACAARYVGLWMPTHTAVLILIGATLAGLCGLALAIRPWLAGVRR